MLTSLKAKSPWSVLCNFLELTSLVAHCYRYLGDKFNFPFHWMMTCIKNEDLIVQLFRTQVSGAAVSAWETICAPGSSSFSQRLSSFNFKFLHKLKFCFFSRLNHLPFDLYSWFIFLFSTNLIRRTIYDFKNTALVVLCGLVPTVLMTSWDIYVP